MRRRAGHAAGLGLGVSRALGTPRPPGCVPGQPRTAPHRLANALRAARIAGGEIELPLLCAGGLGHAAGCGQGASRALSTPRPPGCVPGPSRAPALALAAASRICTSACAPHPLTLTLTQTLTLTDAFRAVITSLVLVPPTLTLTTALVL